MGSRIFAGERFSFTLERFLNRRVESAAHGLIPSAVPQWQHQLYNPISSPFLQLIRTTRVRAARHTANHRRVEVASKEIDHASVPYPHLCPGFVRRVFCSCSRRQAQRRVVHAAPR